MDVPDSAHASFSAEQAADSQASASRPTRPATNYAFLVHSPDSVTNKLAPAVDNKALARQRRRRTSPEDQAILEYEFARDSKPDKTSRARIAARVALGEKEVQIWFQNRRSTARRRTSPYVPPEHLSSPGDVQASDLDPILAALRSSSSQDNQHDPDGASSSDFHREWSAFVSGAGQRGMAALLPPRPLDPEAPEPLQESQARATAAAAAAAAEEREAEEARNIGEGQHDTITTTTKPEPKTLARSSSSVRLSLTSSGGAKILHSDETTPSPPRPSQNPLSPSTSSVSSSSARGLRRSYSVAGLTDSFAHSQSSHPPPRRLRRDQSSGRSRDSRAWEFWCDADSRNDLAKHAEQDQKGSAADAIGLIRSKSRHRSLMETSSNVQSSSASNRLKSPYNASKPTLRQSKSSVASFGSSKTEPVQIFEDESATAVLKSPARQRGRDQGNPDSDKENWDPDNSGRRKATSNPRKTMEEAGVLNSNRSLTRPTLSSARQKVIDMADQEEEVTAFMRGGKARAGPGDDIDCIQGLLFLSQGSWK